MEKSWKQKQNLYPNTHIYDRSLSWLVIDPSIKNGLLTWINGLVQTGHFNTYQI
jgi:hypothetical protein